MVLMNSGATFWIAPRSQLAISATHKAGVVQGIKLLSMPHYIGPAVASKWSSRAASFRAHGSNLVERRQREWPSERAPAIGKGATCQSFKVNQRHVGQHDFYKLYKVIITESGKSECVLPHNIMSTRKRFAWGVYSHSCLDSNPFYMTAPQGHSLFPPN